MLRRIGIYIAYLWAGSESNMATLNLQYTVQRISVCVHDRRKGSTTPDSRVSVQYHCR